MIKAEQRQIVWIELYLAVVKCCEVDYLGSNRVVASTTGEAEQVKGGGAVSLGDDPRHATITLTKNYFEDDASKYDNNGYGQNIYAWFDILGHEVKHLDHIAESGNKLLYVFDFAAQYMKMGHDNVPKEKEADTCRNLFEDFYNHVSNIYGVDSFENLFSEKADKEIIQTIDLWWNDFKNSK